MGPLVVAGLVSGLLPSGPSRFVGAASVVVVVVVASGSMLVGVPGIMRDSCGDADGVVVGAECAVVVRGLVVVWYRGFRVRRVPSMILITRRVAPVSDTDSFFDIRVILVVDPSEIDD